MKERISRTQKIFRTRILMRCTNFLSRVISSGCVLLVILTTDQCIRKASRLFVESFVVLRLPTTVPRIYTSSNSVLVVENSYHHSPRPTDHIRLVSRATCFLSVDVEADTEPEDFDSSYERYYNFWSKNMTLVDFNMDLQNIAIENPYKAMDALEIMIKLYQQDPSHPYTVQPDISSFLIVLEATSHDGPAAQKILDTMEASSIKPNDLAFMLVAQAWSEFEREDDVLGTAARKAEKLLTRTRNIKVWSIVLEAWCKRAGKVRNALHHAEEILNKMEHSTDDLRPNVLTYTSLIGGIAKSRSRDMGQRAEEVLVRMREHGVEPDVVAYTSVLNCWAKAVSRKERQVAASRAVRLLTDMERLYSKQNYNVKPSAITYNTAICAIGNSLDPSAPKTAEEILKRMYNLSRSGKIANLKPTTSTYNAVLNALARAPTNKVRHARRAEQLLTEMQDRATADEKDVQPNVRTWAAVIRSWAVSGQPDAAENAERVLKRLEQLYSERKSIVRPNYVCYTTVMGAWGRSKQRNALDKMESLLKYMENEYERTQEPDIRPNTVSYVTAIDAFVRKGERNSAQKAQETVDRMLRLYAKGLGHVRPSRIIFNTLINAWSRSDAPNAAEKAEEIFQWMEAQYEAGDVLVRPDEVSLCAVLNAWANHASKGKGAARAHQILEHMESISLEKRGFHLSITMPNIVIKALARSGEVDAVRKAESLLTKLEKDAASGSGLLKPDITTYSSMINCCAYYNYPEGQSEALQVAFRAFKTACDLEDERPNNIIFGTLFKAMANLMPPNDEREKLSRQFFDQCCTEGMVDGFVLSQVRRACPQLYRELVDEPIGLGGPGHDDRIGTILKNVPMEWSANVVE